MFDDGLRGYSLVESISNITVKVNFSIVRTSPWVFEEKVGLFGVLCACRWRGARVTSPGS